MAVQKLFVPGLTREAESRVEQALRQLGGVLFAIANSCDSCVEVEFDDDRVGLDALRAALAELGLEARLGG